MKHLIQTLSLGATLLVLSGFQNHAITLSLLPGSQSIGVGDSAPVQIFLQGLGAGGPPSLGAFDIEVLYDDSVLSLDAAGATLGSFLGIPEVETIVSVTDLPGSFSVAEISFLFDFELDALQPADFTLATLNFTALAEGTSQVDFGFVELVDAGLTPAVLSVDSMFASSVTVASAPATVPDSSSTGILLAGAFLGILSLRKRKTQVLPVRK